MLSPVIGALPAGPGRWYSNERQFPCLGSTMKLARSHARGSQGLYFVLIELCVLPLDGYVAL